ncbi:hypothetical protein Ddye_007993 [Dipteronia dyeriana]|uniref:Pentatricopeptide repeat-containing protein n=1 Tax=Dipteronia dyeriana TaxID=168575 RepID=A0AAE0CKY6_9ROSI|nr:hypothetical protein Ddye_007993 [Dipteronia dyeriana]
MVLNGLCDDIFTLSRLIFSFALLGSEDSLIYSRNLFSQIDIPNVFIWNTMMRGYSRSNSPHEALILYMSMLSKGIESPNNFTYPFVLNSCVRLSSLKRGLGSRFIRWFINTWLTLILICCLMLLNAAVIDMYAKCGLMNMAERVFSTMRTKNTTAWSCMVSEYTRGREVETARQLFDQMEQRDVVYWTTMISVYLQARQLSEALELFRHMEYMSIQPDDVTLVAVFSSCDKLGALDFGKRVLQKYVENVMLGRNVFLTTALIAMYAKCRSIKSALEVFNRIPNDLKIVSLSNSTISSLARHGLSKTIVAIFREMESMGPRPDGVTFVGIL